MFWKVTFTSHAGFVSEVLVEGPVENAVRQAVRYVPFMTIASYKLEEYDPEVDPDHADSLLADAYGELCDKCDGNEDVSDAEFEDGLAEYRRGWNALNDAIG